LANYFEYSISKNTLLNLPRLYHNSKKTAPMDIGAEI
jgi:hypothetical protein